MRMMTHYYGDQCPSGHFSETLEDKPITDLATHKSDGKPLVGDMDPEFILEMGEVMAQGLIKYPNDPDGQPNWYKGGDYRSFCASIIRHALKLAGGEDFDEESNLPHAAHIAIDAMFLRSWERRDVGNDSRLNWGIPLGWHL